MSPILVQMALLGWSEQNCLRGKCCSVNGRRFYFFAKRLPCVDFLKPWVQVKLGTVAATVGKFGLAVSVACFFAQTIIWLAEMGKKVTPEDSDLLDSDPLHSFISFSLVAISSRLPLTPRAFCRLASGSKRTAS